jgi:hypothetical protein
MDAAEQSTEGDFDFGIPNGLSFVYERDGSTLTARGVTSGYVRSDSTGLANNLLVVGSSFDPKLRVGYCRLASSSAIVRSLVVQSELIQACTRSRNAASF